MKTIIALILAVTVGNAVAGTTPRDADGVPKVDIHGTIVVVKPATVKDGWHVSEQRVRYINFDDTRMPIEEFYLTFCMGKKNTNETCDRAQRIMMIDMASGPGKLPKGL